MPKTTGFHERHDLVPESGTARIVAGAMTWLLLVMIPWLAVAVMFSLLVFPLAPVAAVTGGAYLTLSMRAERKWPRALGAIAVVAGILWTEWCALMTADRMARMMLAASRGRSLELDVVGPMASSLLGVALFYVGMRAIRAKAGGRGALWPTLAVALICPLVAALVQLNALPLSA